MKTKEYLFSLRLVLLMIANTALDYTAVAEYTGTEPFKLDQLGVGNLVSIIVAFGITLALSVAAQRAATWKVKGDEKKALALLVGSAIACVIVAGFRLSYDAASAGRSISGGVLSSLSVADVFFAGMLLLMLVGEVITSYHDRLSEYEKEAMALEAAIVRINMDLGNIDAQSKTAARIVNARIFEVAAAVNAADEMVYENTLKHAGELQNAFVGYIEEGKKARNARSESLKKRFETMLLPVSDGDDSPDVPPAPVPHTLAGSTSHVERAAARAADAAA